MNGQDREIAPDRALRRQNTDTDALFKKIERRLHTMHLSARKASLMAGLPPEGASRAPTK
jgi:hypothetical protein